MSRKFLAALAAALTMTITAFTGVASAGGPGITPPPIPVINGVPGCC